MGLWYIRDNDYNWQQARKKETIYTLANGYRALRGNIEFSDYGQPGNFIAGIFDKSFAQVTEIVNCQNPLIMNIYLEDELVRIESSQVLNFSRNLNLKEGLYKIKVELITPRGWHLKAEWERYVSKNNNHRWASKYKVSSNNFKGKMFIENIIDGRTLNSLDDPWNKVKHFDVEKTYDLSPGIAMITQTIDSKTRIIEGTSIVCEKQGRNIFRDRKYRVFGEQVREIYELFVDAKEEITFCKYGVTYTSRDGDFCLYSKLMDEMKTFIATGYEEEKYMHISKWSIIWDDIDVKIQGDDKAQAGMRFNLFQLYSSASEEDSRVSIGAKGLHGEGYKGHVFWDTEIFMIPFFTYTSPKVAKNLLMYRYNTLKGAKENAFINGYKGAQYPWESADTGLEVTPKWGRDYEGNSVRIWTGDEEFHINSDIVFALINYYTVTGDEDFMKSYGIEIILETAKFWESRVEYNREKNRYEINKVIGPDEFHEHVNNNVYTNYLAKWNMIKAIEYANWLKDKEEVLYRRLCNNLGISEVDLNRWEDIQAKIYIPKGEDGKLIEQFEGYFKLEDIAIEEYDENNMPIWPKKLELKNLSNTQLIKQPDVVMLAILLGDEFDYDTKKINYEYYEKRTMHKSSLSPSMYSIMGIQVGDTKRAYKYFMKTIMTDLEDNQGNADFGLHAASTGGSWQTVVFGFGGLSIDKEGILNFKPWLPKEWENLSYKIKWRGTDLEVSMWKEWVEFKASDSLNIKVHDTLHQLSKDKILKVNN